MAKRPTMQRTKAQILEAFDQLYEENAQLQAQYDQVLQAKEALERTATGARPPQVVAPGEPVTPTS